MLRIFPTPEKTTKKQKDFQPIYFLENACLAWFEDGDPAM